MATDKLSRRDFLKTVGVAASSLAISKLPVFNNLEAMPATPGATLPTTGLFAPNIATLQENLTAFADLRFGMFLHFSLGTFTDEEWAAPNQSPTLFAPTAVDCTQWAQTAVAAGMKFGILTTKHHDGFCLWPTAYSSQNVMNSSYQHDVVAMYVNAMRAAGLKVGLYYSIWDRTKDVQGYNGTSLAAGTAYIDQSDIDFCKNQITELLTNYGTIDIFITDGYGWEMGQQAVPYQQIRELVKSLQPNTILIDHGGLSQPWLGDAIYFEEPKGITSPAGNTYASCQGQTISNGWFWHPSTPYTDPMSLSSILSHLADLEPKYTTFILNCPPNRNGVLDTNIVNRLTQVGSNWAPNPSRSPLPTQPLRVEHPVTPRSAWASTYHTTESASNAIDGLSDDWLETCWSSIAVLPQSITLDLGGVYNNISTLEYLPRQWNRNGSTDGDITSYTIYVSTDGTNFTQVATGSWAGDQKTKLAEWSATSAAYIRLQANAASGGFACASGIQVGGRTAIPVKTNTTALFNGAGYFIAINRTNNMVLDGDGSVSSGASLKQRNWEGSNNMQWQITDLGNGYCKIINRTNGLSIDTNQQTTSGSTLVQKTYTGSNYQQWQLIPIGMGYYMIKSRASGLVIDSGGSVASGSIVKQYAWDGSTNLMWRLEKVDAAPTTFPVAGVNYRLICRHSGKVAGVGGGSTADGADIIQWSWLGVNDQKWSFVSLGSGYYKIVNLNSGKVADVSGASTFDGGDIIQWSWSGGNNQQWTLTDIGGGYYRITNRNSGKVMDVDGASSADGADIIQWAAGNGNNQKWQIIPA